MFNVMMKPYTPGDLKTFDICYDNTNAQSFLKDQFSHFKL